ncbi:Vitamin B12 ABC transporter, ATPase component BtuD [Roseibacterium elongatum DSM 19469]|uniref:Vitamin B12 ABC transporter, ATPase component BtuD n=1 Tax=Roseicyclus elongatus DSM 19469 TaxID=1294273 RepID=W8RQJ6_9RHOB|nr:ABC transporter ATP-binding protein [Roseibacterium elongatum]AHM03404.1 Vitamin B12 ABC transporter, ATPase component BtuD [Roseibacterium elongatum DSM 19469]
MTLLALDQLTVKRGPCPVVNGVSLSVDRGEVVGLIGPNGAGKTTLFRGALGLISHSGTSSLAQLSPADRARAAAWMPQAREIAWPIAVETLVMLGRVPHLAGGQRPSERDHAAVAEAIADMGLVGFETRPATDLSGGEQARVLIARTLAQDCPLIVADEPIAGLDPAHQIATMDLFARIARQGKSVLVSLHDLGLAARHCSRLILMHQGRIVADGTPRIVLTPKNLHDVFGISAHLTEGPDGMIFQPLEVLR